MNRFKNILFVADGTAGEKAALRKTLELARLNKARVSVIDVMEENIEAFPITEGTYNLIHVHKSLVKDRLAELKKLVASVKPRTWKKPIPVTVREGKDFIEIIRAVKAKGYDLVVKASGKPHVTGMLLSTLDMNLIRKCPCAVLVLKPRKKISHSRILATVDLRSVGQSAKNLDRTIMELASSLAHIEKGKLHILHAWHVAFEQQLRNRKSVQAAYKSVNTMLREMRKVEHSHLEELAGKYGLTETETHLIKGEPATVIPRFVKSHRIDLVVMGSVGRTGIKGFFIGNTAEKVLNNINCSVLAIKPAGFVSPVK